MKIGQSSTGFAPIMLTLETRHEAELFLALVRGDQDYDNDNMKAFRSAVSDWFSNQAKL